MFTLFKLDDMAKKDKKTKEEEIIEEEAVEETTEDTEEEVIEEKIEETKEEEKTEEAPEGDVIVDEVKQNPEEKAASATLKKILNFIEDKTEKSDSIEKFATVEEMQSLEERLSKVEQTVVPTKARATYTVEKFDKAEGNEETLKKKERYAELKTKIEKGTNSVEELKEARSLEYDLRKGLV
jgi:hypothetical protein